MNCNAYSLLNFTWICMLVYIQGNLCEIVSQLESLSHSEVNNKLQDYENQGTLHCMKTATVFISQTCVSNPALYLSLSSCLCLCFCFSLHVPLNACLSVSPFSLSLSSFSLFSLPLTLTLPFLPSPPTPPPPPTSLPYLFILCTSVSSVSVSLFLSTNQSEQAFSLGRYSTIPFKLSRQCVLIVMFYFFPDCLAW